MISVHSFTFNAFMENTYIVWDETGECAIFDPGCNADHEREELADFISKNNLKPVRLINTHCHIDHMCGNKFVAETYGLKLEIHEKEKRVLQGAAQYGVVFGFIVEPSPDPGHYLEPGEVIRFGNTRLLALYTPGHAPGELSFYCKEGGFVLAGDALFQGSIGRTDLPGGHAPTLLAAIKNELLTLPEDTIVYSGHGPSTTIGIEKRTNPFLQPGAEKWLEA